MKAMILAAGIGQRMLPLTQHTPKPLLTVKGRSLLDYHVQNLKDSGIKEIVINISHLGKQIKAALGDGNAYGVKILYSEEESPLETGGGIVQALPLLGTKPFMVVSGDIWTDYSYAKLPKEPEGLAHLVLNDAPAFNLKGDYALEGALVKKQGEKKLNYAGIAVMRPELFEGCVPGIYPVAPLFEKAMAENRVTGEVFHGRWYNIGTPEILEEVNEVL